MRLISACTRIGCLLWIGTELLAQDVDAVVAQLGTRTILKGELETTLGDSLLALKSDIYKRERAALGGYVEALALFMEAESRGVSVNDLLSIEVQGHVLPPSDAEARAVAEANQGYGSLDDASVKSAHDMLLRQRISRRRTEFVAALLKKYKLQVFLDSPRAKHIPIGSRHSIGPDAAPIAILEYSDFQCPTALRCPMY